MACITPEPSIATSKLTEASSRPLPLHKYFFSPSWISLLNSETLLSSSRNIAEPSLQALRATSFQQFGLLWAGHLSRGIQLTSLISLAIWVDWLFRFGGPLNAACRFEFGRPFKLARHQNSAVQNSGPEIVQTSAVSQYRPTMDSPKMDHFWANS